MSTPRWGITTLVEGQASGETTANTALIILECLNNAEIKDRDLATPPGSPANGDLYLVAASPTGAWTGQASKLALYYNGWMFFTPRNGMTALIVDEKIAVMYSAVESLWFPLQPLWSSSEHWTGRYIGSAKVYSKTVSFGAVPGALANKLVAHGITGLAFGAYIQAEVSTNTATYSVAVPQPSPAGGGLNAAYEVSVTGTDVSLTEIAGVDYSGTLTAYVRLTYTK